MGAAMRITIVKEDDLSRLAARYPGLRPLAQGRPPAAAAFAWNQGRRHDVNVLFLGKTGHGKSSLLNRLTGSDCFPTSDVEACTRNAVSAEYAWPGRDGQHLSLVDMPGLGESQKRDDEYRRLYQEHCRCAGAVVWVLAADRRDHAVDLESLKALFGSTPPAHLLFALNMVDRLPPLNRREPGLSSAQLETLTRKREECARQFRVEVSRVLPVSAATGHGLSELMAAVGSAVLHRR